MIANAVYYGSGTIEYDMVSYSSAISDCEKGQQDLGAHCSTSGCYNGADRGPRAPGSFDLKPKDVKGELEGMNTIAHAEAKRTEKFMTIDEVLQEMIDEVDRDGEGEVNEKEFLRIMEVLTFLEDGDLRRRLKRLIAQRERDHR